MKILGIDIGGSGIKAAIVDTETGQLTTERYRIPTPTPSKPPLVALVIRRILAHFQWKGPVGVAFPMVIANGRASFKSNIDHDWDGVQVDELFSNLCGTSFTVINDADAAGLAEMKFGAGKGKNGLVLMITVGTGLGSGAFFNGQLIPNFELGHIYHTNGQIIESFAADSVRKREGLSYEEWGKRFDVFLNHIERIFSPNLVIIGGGTSKKMHKFQHLLTTNLSYVAAQNLNNAGIIGAALYAAKQL